MLGWMPAEEMSVRVIDETPADPKMAGSVREVLQKLRG